MHIPTYSAFRTIHKSHNANPTNELQALILLLLAKQTSLLFAIKARVNA